MTRALSMISTFTSNRIAGRVAFPHNPAHRPVLHLCDGLRLVVSRMADERLHQLDGTSYVRDFEFSTDGLKLSRFSPDSISIIVAETGERLVQPAQRPGQMTVEDILRRGSQPPRGLDRTYEDALLYGYCGQEIVSLLFQDYLGRPCEDGALHHWEAMLENGSTVTGLVQALIYSPEYSQRQINIGSLPGRLFDNPLLYMADKTRMRELQDATYAAPLHDLIIDLRPLAREGTKDFADSIFRTLLMRSPDDDACKHFVNCLNDDWLRRNIAAGLVASPEFNNNLLVGGFDALDDPVTSSTETI